MEELPTGSTGQGLLKKKNAFTEDALSRALAFVKEGSGASAVYWFLFDLTTDEFEEAFANNPGSLNDIILEITITTPTEVISAAVACIVLNRYLRDDENLPQPADPDYPSSSELAASLLDARSKIVDVADSDARFALTEAEVNIGDLVREYGLQQITRVDVVADVAGSLAGTSFVIQTSDVAAYFWFKVGGVGADPATAEQGIEVDIAQGAAANVVAAAIKAAADLSGLWDSVVQTIGTLDFTDKLAGYRDAYDNDSGHNTYANPEGYAGTGFVFVVVDVEQLGAEAGYKKFAVGKGDVGIISATSDAEGLLEIATNAETQTGADAARAVVPSALAAWWTWVKTQTQTIAAAWTWSANQTFNGTSNTMPNQSSLSSAASLVNRALLTDEWVWSAPRTFDMELGSAVLSASTNATSVIAPGRIAMTILSTAVNGNNAIATMSRDLIDSDGSGGTTNFTTRFFAYFRLGGGIASNLTMRCIIGATSGQSGTLANKGIGFRMTSDTTAVLMVHNGATLVESSSFTIDNFGTQKHFLLENLGNGTVNIYYIGGNGGARFSQTPTATLTGGPTGSVGAASGKNCIVAQLVATGAAAQNSTIAFISGKVYFP